MIIGTHGGLFPVIRLAFEMIAFLSTLMVRRKKSTMPQVHTLPVFVQVYTFFVIEVGPRHIYDDTGFCHNYHHRILISMTEKKIRSAQNVTDVSFFTSVTLFI